MAPAGPGGDDGRGRSWSIAFPERSLPTCRVCCSSADQPIDEFEGCDYKHPTPISRTGQALLRCVPATLPLPHLPP